MEKGILYGCANDQCQMYKKIVITSGSVCPDCGKELKLVKSINFNSTEENPIGF